MNETLLSHEIPNGVYPTMITPFTDDNHIDFDGVLQLLEWYSRNHVSGIFALCQSSEIFHLSFQEKFQLLSFIMDNRPENLKILASGHTAEDLETQIYEANAYISLGIDAYVFINNRLAKEDESDIVFMRNLERVVKELQGTQFGFYECPYPYKRLLTPDMIREIGKWGKFSFLKDTCCDVEMIREKLIAMEGTGFKLFNANASTLLKTLKLGCAGYSGVMANFHPDLYVWLCKNFNTKQKKANIIQDFIGFFSVIEYQQYPVNAKYYLGLEGLQIELYSRVRDPVHFKDYAKAEIEQMHRMNDYLKKCIFDSKY